MLVAVVKELKQGEGRVACTPENVRKLTAAGHKVIVAKMLALVQDFLTICMKKKALRS